MNTDEMSELPRADELLGCLCLQVRKLTRIVTQIYDRALEPVGLTCTQFSVLAVLQNRSDLSVGELADLLVMDPTTTTRLLQPLQRRGLVILAASQEDRRRRVLEPTSEGRAQFRMAVPHWRKARREVEQFVGASQADELVSTIETSVAALAVR